MYFSSLCFSEHFLFSTLFYCKNTMYNTYIKYVLIDCLCHQGFPSTTKLLVVKFWGRSKGIHEFSTSGRGVGNPVPIVQGSTVFSTYDGFFLDITSR